MSLLCVKIWFGEKRENLILIAESVNRVSEITGKKIASHILDMRDKKGLQDMFSKVGLSAEWA